MPPKSNTGTLESILAGFVAVLIMIAIVALTGCTDERPALQTKVVREEVPIPVPCIAATDIPAIPPKVGAQLTGDAVNDASVLASYALRLRGALVVAVDELNACKTLH